MTLQRIVVAADESDAGRWAVRAALDLAAGTGAEVAVLRAVGVVSRRALADTGAVAIADEPPTAPQVEVERLSRWLAPELAGARSGVKVSLAVTYGVPSIEICRYAEETRTDLVVLGRKRRSAKTRLLIGDTGDAVARRSPVPCLFVPPGSGAMRRVLAALDGTDWGLTVMVTANRLASAAGAELRTVTVEQPVSGETGSAAPPLARTALLQQRVRETLGRDPGARLNVRRGAIV
ncbi:MAG TPA: universal stress protein, partial [Gemmatimonadales bacterium]|nr:universal stress protein [Gemmatimonadales bacterium]